MQVNLLKKIVEEIAGKQSVEIVALLFGKKDVNEFIIAKKLKLTINQTRNMLYKLSDSGIVSFIRKKDKRKGWYIYFWTLNTLKSLELLEKNIFRQVENLEAQLRSRRIKRFYYCETCNVEVGEETALFNDFTCQECGQVYTLSKNDKIIKELEHEIAKLKKEIGSIEAEKHILAEQESKKSRKISGKKKAKKSLKKKAKKTNKVKKKR